MRRFGDNRYANPAPASVVLLAAATAGLFIAMAWYCQPLQPGAPALQFTYSQAAFNAIIEAWGTSGVARFKGHFLIDFPFLICYGLLGFWIATRTALFAHLSPPLRTGLTWCLPAAATADAVENLLHWHLVSGAGPFAAAMYLAAGSVATTKWALDAVFVAYSVLALSTRCFKR